MDSVEWRRSWTPIRGGPISSARWRSSVSIALQAARDQVIQAVGVIADLTIDLVGAIGRAVLDNFTPARRLRLSPRAVKRPMSRYAYKSLRVDRHTYKATTSIDILLTRPISP
ncbi:hypothetical protein GCM10023080_030750 [Streptomyces pseudoechinosporeus]